MPLETSANNSEIQKLLAFAQKSISQKMIGMGRSIVLPTDASNMTLPSPAIFRRKKIDRQIAGCKNKDFLQ